MIKKRLPFVALALLVAASLALLAQQTKDKPAAGREKQATDAKMP